MLRYGAHAFVWLGDWDTASGNDTIRKAAETGFDFLEIPLLKPDSFDARSHQQVLEGNGFGGHRIAGAAPRGAYARKSGGGQTVFARRVRPHGGARQHLSGRVLSAIRSGPLTGAPPTSEERATIVEGLQEIAEDARARGITLALEACNRYETHLYNTLHDTREAVLATGASNLHLHADTYHMNIEEEGFYKPFVENADVLGYVHMSESHRGLVGTGTVVWDEVFRGLKDASFSGDLVLESFAAINPDIAAATCLWRPTNEPPEVLATQGLAFLQAGAQKHGLA